MVSPTKYSKLIVRRASGGIEAAVLSPDLIFTCTSSRVGIWPVRVLNCTDEGVLCQTISKQLL